jgi:hypothetical protein
MLNAIEGAANAVGALEKLISGLSTSAVGQARPDGATVTQADVDAAIARGRQAAGLLSAHAQAVLDRINRLAGGQPPADAPDETAG